ncbi:hypothetical protein NMK71_07405 [Weeksellaceae bacterium KMM 9713]|uniref:Uncharacterized protein n=1 Tax=Profundicola chukchiensis TaxID=2961959 RepID=A0A9X4N070_9FLAO|nr:hypothetical protein [Profundicola chukchiensis]MDG4946235.1 hypothetical protein [Profundicola chukchiensis]
MLNHIQKLIFLLVLILVGCKTEVKTHEIQPQSSIQTSCDRAKLDAKTSFENENYTFTIYGLNLSSLKKQYQYKSLYDSILLSDYKVKYKQGGCVISDYTTCYEKELKRYVENKYGKDYLSIAKSKALTIYSKTEEYKTKVLPLLKRDTIFNAIEPAEYNKRVNRSETITHFIKNKLGEEISNSKISFQYILYKNGEIEIIKFYSPENIKEQEKIKTALENLPQLDPAYFFTEPVNSYQNYRLKN